MLKSNHVNDVVLSGNFTIGNSGAVSTQTAVEQCGVTVTKVNATSGRYLLTFQRTWGQVKSAHATMVGPDTSAFPTTTGSAPKLRQQTTSSVMVQFIREDTQADADPASGTIGNFTIIVSKSS
jgi:hypothetical protein